MDLESLLRRAAASPLGPLRLTCDPTGPDAWSLKVEMTGVTTILGAEREPSTEGVVLTRKLRGLPSPAPVAASSWVVERRDGEDGTTELRLWLHGDGLGSAMLLNAIAALAQIEGVTAAEVASIPAPEPLPLIPIEAPQPEPGPEPLPVSSHRGVSWESFAFGGAGTRPTSEGATTEPIPPSPVSPASDEAEIARDDALPESHVSPPEATGDAAEAGEAGARGIVAAGSPDPAPELPAQPETASTETAVSAERATGALPEETLPKPSGKTGYCRECGSPYAADHVFCTNCGARLD